MHVTEHCQLPEINRHWRPGMVYACTCHKLYRVSQAVSSDGFYKRWEELDAPRG